MRAKDVIAMIDAAQRGASFRAFIRDGTIVGPPVLDIHYHVCCPIMRYGKPQCP